MLEVKYILKVLIDWAGLSHKQEQFVCVVAAAISCIILLAWYERLNNDEKSINQEIITLQKTLYLAAFQKKSLTQSISTSTQNKIMNLNEMIKRLFNSLAQPNDVGICFNTVKREKNEVVLIGKVKNANDLMSYLKTWTGAQFFSQIKIEKIQQYSDVIQFQLFAAEMPTLTISTFSATKKHATSN